MVQNSGRLLALIAILLVTSLALILVPDQPLRMGLDLAGGTRQVWSLDIEQARKDGVIAPNESDSQVIEEQIAIIRQRIDPSGVLEPIIRKVGANSIEVALPNTFDTKGASAVAPLDGTVDSTARSIRLQGAPTDLAGFPAGGGVVSIGAERVRYEARVNNVLQVDVRGFEKTQPSEHQAGVNVTLVSDDAIKNAIENLGDLRFAGVADRSDFQTRGTDQQIEEAKRTSWLADPANAGLPIEVYNRLNPEQGGAPEGILWFPDSVSEGEEVPPLAQRNFLAVVRPPEEWTFSGADLQTVFKTVDQAGFPAVGFEMTTNARIPFGDFTEEHVQEQMAIVLNDVVVSAPVINQALRGSSIIQGRFTDRQVDEMVTVLRSGSLKIKPQLESEEKVGATLGADYVRRGFLGGLIAVAATLLFMLVYYRRLGAVACAALVCNMIMIAGAMVFLQATLTLPGIAGIILTIGMAVDANILIFDRLREEAEKGHKTAQAAKEGFQNALSAIVDGNVTTLLTALILYNVGTGPIRGFAVTLSVGILTSVFAALVITRVLVHLQLESGVKKFEMARLMADAKYRFLDKGKLAATLSTVVIVAGVGLFLVLPKADKLGIDFMGGASLKVRTEQAMQAADLRQLVKTIPGELSSADVAALPGSSTEDGYTEFRITFKTSGEDAQSAGAERNLQTEVQLALAEVLQKGPIECSVEPTTGRVDAVLYFEDNHQAEDVDTALDGTALADLLVNAREGREDVFVVSGEVTIGTSESIVRAALAKQFTGTKDTLGRDYKLASAIAESSVIGAQVVGELRDSAIRAILLSILLTVIYIRVRFAEYSYGIAAVAAVVHDILTTLGMVAVLVALPFIQVEMNLTLIAAFLTIFGYSLNDTIIIFDRVRENLPRVKGSFKEVVNLSINQTLSRTVVTSGTTLTSTLLILAFNFGTGNALEGFGFALSWGILSGTYSTIFIACPLLVWLEERNQRKAQEGGSGGDSKRSGSGKSPQPAPTTT